MLRIIAVLLTGLLAVGTHAATSDTRPLRVATAADHPPLTYLAEGKVVGMEADFARLLENQLRRPLHIQVLPAAELLPALARGEVDLVMSGLTITPERERLADFTLPYLQVGQMSVIRTADVLRFRNPASLLQGGYRVGFVGGSAGERYVKDQLQKAQLLPQADSQAGLQALLDNRIDVFIDDAATSWGIATEPHYGALMSLYRPLTEEYLGWAVAKNNPELREQLNQVLLHVKQQQVFEHILNRWVPVRVAAD